jgi:hypothetical protein
MSQKGTIHVALRFRHPSLAASRITEQVGLKPSVAHERGTKVTIVGGERRPNELNYCSFDLSGWKSREVATEAIAKGIRILDRNETFWIEFLATGGSIDYFIGIHTKSNYGWVIPNGLLSGMAKWKIDLGIDFYGRKL